MTTKAHKVKSTRKPKYPTQEVKRCLGCFRHNTIRFRLCRCCFFNNANRGDITGFSKSS